MSEKLGTNLAEVGTDCISRQAAIDALKNDMASLDHIIKGMSANDVRLDAYVSQRNQVNYDICTVKNLPHIPATEPCEDAVSREEVLNCLEWQYPDKTPRTKIMELPPVTPKQRTGHWIPQDHNKRAGNISTCVYYYPTCSECGQVGNETYKYCPHCGAKMTEGDAERKET